MPSLFLTSLPPDPRSAQALLAALKPYGLAVQGRLWADDLERMAWLGPAEVLRHPDTALWLVAGSAGDWAAPTVRYGLALLALKVQAARGANFPFILVNTSADPLDPQSLPDPFRGAAMIPAGHPQLGAKVTAAAHLPVAPAEVEYRLEVHAAPGLGTWFEVGPAAGSWSGALFGVDGGRIDAHGVGPRGLLPHKAVLKYPQKGIVLRLEEREFTAWAVRNVISAGESYYLRVWDLPAQILFGPYDPAGDDLDLHRVRLQ